MATQKGSGLISRAVREALSTLVAPDLCEQLINRSLAAHGLQSVPENGTEIGEWLEGPLRSEVENVVGSDAAELMMMQLGPIAAYAAIAQRSQPSSAPPPAEPARQRETRSSEPPPVPLPSSPARAQRTSDWDDDRPTDLRFDVSAEPVWTPASQPPKQSSKQPSTPARTPFRSEPPTGVFGNASAAGSPPALFSALRPTTEPQVRTLPPAKRISEVPAPPDLRGRTARPAPADDHPEPGKNLPLVFAATNNQSALRELRRYLASAASVLHVPDLVGLLDALDEPGVVEPIVLIDCHSPTVHITSVAAIGEDLPRGTTVVLWGVNEGTWQQLDRERSPACRWVRCSSEATTDDVGSLCSMLLG